MSKNGVSLGPDVNPTQQHFKQETDIHTIIERFQSGIMPVGNNKAPMYIDLSEHPTLHEAMTRVTQATQAFRALPSNIRLRFHNNPQELIKFCQDDKNLEEAEKLGLVPRGSYTPPEPKKPASTPKEAEHDPETKMAVKQPKKGSQEASE